MATQEVSKTGNLYYLINAFIGAYNRRTDMLAKPPIGETSIAQKLDAIIEMLRNLAAVPGELALVKEELSIVHGLVQNLENPPSPSKSLEVTFVFKVANDHPDEPFAIAIGGVTDAEGEPLPGTQGLTVAVESSDDAVVSATFDPATNTGVAHFGKSGVAALTAKVSNAKGEILGSGSAGFTVTTGDPAAVSDVKIAFSGLTEEPEAPPV